MGRMNIGSITWRNIGDNDWGKPVHAYHDEAVKHTLCGIKIPKENKEHKGSHYSKVTCNKCKKQWEDN